MSSLLLSSKKGDCRSMVSADSSVLHSLEPQQVFFGGEDRIKNLTTWLTAKQSDACFVLARSQSEHNTFTWMSVFQEVGRQAGVSGKSRCDVSGQKHTLTQYCESTPRLIVPSLRRAPASPLSLLALLARCQWHWRQFLSGLLARTHAGLLACSNLDHEARQGFQAAKGSCFAGLALQAVVVAL